MAIGNKRHAICCKKFLKTGQTKAYEERKAFHASLASQAETTRARIESTIANLDPNPHHKVFERGCQVLLHWYRTKVGDGDAHLAEELGWEFRFGIPFPGTTGIRNSASDFGVPELSGGKANRKT